jgi:hypothetical protein
MRYFNLAKSQTKWQNLSVGEDIFEEWYNKLAPDPVTEEKNWYLHATSCIHHLVSHKDAPTWLRDKYINHKRADRRIAALMTNSGSYKYKHIDKILSDRSKNMQEQFLALLAEDIKKEQIDFTGVSVDSFSKILSICGSTGALFVKALYELQVNEFVLNLLDPNPLVRNMAKWYESIDQQEKDLLNTIVKILYKSVHFMDQQHQASLKNSSYQWDNDYHKYKDLLEIIKAAAQVESETTILISRHNYIDDALISQLEQLSKEECEYLRKWVSLVPDKTRFRTVKVK